jgi:diguanylate cyclase (GGDEF)-like protein/PAS domain S-box-containing protein
MGRHAQDNRLVKQNNILSPQRDNFSGLPIVKASYIGGCVLGALLAIWLGSLVFKPSPAVQGACVLLTAIVVAALMYLVRWHIGFYVQKIEKIMLTVRRMQSKSNYYDSILQDSTDIIFTTDIDGYVLKFNKGAELHFGYLQEEIVGTPLKQLFVNEADERKILSNVLLSGKSVNEEIPMKTKAGEIILLNISISEMKNDYNQIIGLVVTAKDITEKKKLELELLKKNELLSKLAITDGLSELYNVRHFYEQLVKELTRMKRNPERKISLMLMDIDHFKELNDADGHQFGDSVLRSLGQVIKVCIRKDIDTGYRYGGDEFAVILPETDMQHAKVVADRIQKQFGAFKFGRISLSIGITEAKCGETEKSMVKRADECLYQSKRDGRARITLG